jgi:hypothetical protein
VRTHDLHHAASLTREFSSVLARRQTGLGSDAFDSASFELHQIEYRRWEASADEVLDYYDERGCG